MYPGWYNQQQIYVKSEMNFNEGMGIGGINPQTYINGMLQPGGYQMGGQLLHFMVNQNQNHTEGYQSMGQNQNHTEGYQSMGQYHQPMQGYQSMSQYHQPMQGYQSMGQYHQAIQGYQSMSQYQNPTEGYQSIGQYHQAMQGYQSMSQNQNPMQGYQSMGQYHQPMQGYQSMSQNQNPTEGYQSMSQYHQPMQGYQSMSQYHQPMQGYQSMGQYPQNPQILQYNQPPIMYQSMENNLLQKSQSIPQQKSIPKSKLLLQSKITKPITLKFAPSYFSPEKDCEMLNQSIREEKTDENKIIKIICNRTAIQRQEIKKYYLTAFGKDLIKELNNKLNKRFEDALIALFELPTDYDAICIYNAMNGIRTDEDTLIDIIGTRNNLQIKQIKNAFQRIFNQDLIKRIQSEISGSFKRFLISLLKGKRSENTNPNTTMCMNDADELYRAEIGRWGREEETFIKIFSLRSPLQLQLILNFYEEKTNTTLLYSIDNQFSGNTKKLFKTVIFGILSPYEYYASRIYDAIASKDTKEKKLIKILISREEIDLPQIKETYQQLYGRNMMDDIKTDNFNKILNELALH